MCGIFGIVATESSGFSTQSLKTTADHLFKLSESRGKEAAGLALRANDAIHVFRQPTSASAMLRTRKYNALFENTFGHNGAPIKEPVAMLGHSRLATNGLQGINENNQPVIADGLVGVHNGIIVNDDELWARYPDLERHYQVDTEILLCLIRMFYRNQGSLATAVASTFAAIEGAASVALFLNDTNRLILATNTGSLYLCANRAGTIRLFASEQYILSRLTEQDYLKSLLGDSTITRVVAGTGQLVDLQKLTAEPFMLSGQKETPSQKIEPTIVPTVQIVDRSASDDGKSAPFQRCSRCVLPETMPFIEFDAEGVCNYCCNYKKTNVYGHEALERLVAPHRNDSGEPDCLVGFSGGRDSTYGLHYIKNVLKMNPIAFTYDWGMVTDLARRNAARICGKLGIEHIIVSADIKQKRRYIRKNIEAWLKHPDLGMVPLFMAGDKQFYYYARQLQKQTGVPLVFFCAGNELEKTEFKTGFCGISGGSPKGLLTTLPLANKFKLVSYYLRQYARNPSYLNASLRDTIFAYYCSYVLPDDYVYLYHYIQWDEEEIMTSLRNEYDWEIASDTKATWRIGDGTASFYNYIYFTIAGFTEHDTFRSNQIREGLITREQALKLIREENQPRYETIREYTHLVGIDFDDAMYIINAVPKLYKTHDLT